jgi:chemotaxis protein CheD
VTPCVLAVERRRPDSEDRATFDDTIRRYHDPHFGATAVKVLPGEHYITRIGDEMIVTVLGSCVAACIRDPGTGVGGMNHFMLPESHDGQWGRASASLRYGNFAMEHLINEILKQGGRRGCLEIKVFGGANVLRNGANIGHQNAEFIEAYLKAECLPIAARHLYGTLPRRIHYFPSSGRVSMLELHREADFAIIDIEQNYREALEQAPIAGSVELFE